MASLTPASRAHRADLTELASVAERDLRVLFGRFDSAIVAREGLMDVLPRLVAIYGDAAVTLAADWYDDLRNAAGAGGRFSPILADLPGRGRTDALARWAISPLFGADPDFDLTLNKLSGGLQRIITNADRETVQASSIADPKARGWARAGIGRCDFCRMLIGRGAVYTEATADFLTHDRCSCIAVPEF